MPEREELGDNDEALWPRDGGGQPMDVWQNTRMIYLIAADVTAEAFTFITKSGGGRGAVADLGDAIMRMRSVRPDATPVIELQAAKMPTQFGMKSKPQFKIIGWKSVTDQPAPVEKQITHQQAKQEVYRHEIESDDIPFN
jgi:hypothetical protein